MVVVCPRRGCWIALLVAGLTGVTACGRLGYDYRALDDGGGLGDDAPDGDLLAPDADLPDADPLAPDAPEVPDASPADATPVSSMDIVVASGSTEQRNPTLVATGTGFAIVYNELISSNEKLRLATLSSTGALTGPIVELTTTAPFSSFASAAWNGTGVAVVWEGQIGGKSDIWFGRLGAGGALTGEVRLSTAVQLAYFPSIVWTGSGYGVAWDDGKQNISEIYFTRLDANGTQIGAPLQRTSNSGVSTRTSISWTGSEYGLAWEDNVSGAYELYFGRVSSAGATAGGELAETMAGGDVFEPELVWTGSAYGLAWADQRSGTYELYFQRLSSTGAPLAAPLVVSPAGGDARRTQLVWTGSRHGLAWVQDDKVYLAELSAEGAIIAGPTAVADCSPVGDTKISLVRGGGAYGLAWHDRRSGNADIYFRIVAP